MIQDIYKSCGRIFKNEYRNQVPKESDYIMFVRNRTVYVKHDEEILEYMTYKESLKYGLNDNLIYLFSILSEDNEEISFFLGEEERIPEEGIDGFSFENHNIFRVRKPLCKAFAGVTASQLGNWYKANKFCGCCGDRLEHDKAERMMRCPSCNSMNFPKISPAVIVAVTNGEKLLLTKYADRDYKKYALIAGFTEIGETVEETVSREVYEEVGLRVKNIKYYKSQPWSFSDTLLLGFTCELDGDDTIKLDERELSVGTWVDRKDIEVDFDNISLTNEMIYEFKNGNL